MACQSRQTAWVGQIAVYLFGDFISAATKTKAL